MCLQLSDINRVRGILLWVFLSGWARKNGRIVYMRLRDVMWHIGHIAFLVGPVGRNICVWPVNVPHNCHMFWCTAIFLLLAICINGGKVRFVGARKASGQRPRFGLKTLVMRWWNRQRMQFFGIHVRVFLKYYRLDNCIRIGECFRVLGCLVFVLSRYFICLDHLFTWCRSWVLPSNKLGKRTELLLF